MKVRVGFVKNLKWKIFILQILSQKIMASLKIEIITSPRLLLHLN